MNKTIALVFFLISISASGFDASGLQSKVQQDIERSVSKVLPRDDFDVSVNVSSRSRRVREVVQGERVVEKGKKRFAPPPLPGFTVQGESGPQQEEQDRQVYRVIEKQDLGSVQVQLNLDDDTPKDTAQKVEGMIRGYLNQNFPNRNRLSVQSVPMMERPKQSQTPFPYFNWILIGLLLLIALAALFYFLAQRSAPKQVEAQVLKKPRPSSGDGVMYGTSRDSSSGDVFSGEIGETTQQLPSSEKYIDMRSELLKQFSKSSGVFRHYFAELNEQSKQEICGALKGPAFKGLLQTLNIDYSLSDDLVPPPEENLLFYSKDFGEYIQMFAWQREQFFGFLHQLTPGQLVTLFKGQNPMVAALMLKFLGADQAALVLDHLDSDRRGDILSESLRVNKLPTEEISTIESMVRQQVEGLPMVMLEGISDHSEPWSEILARTSDQEGLLIDIERTRPELYPELAKFRFKMEELPALPTPLINKVFDEVDNEELAMALTSCPKDIVDFALNELNDRRRVLIRDQITSYQGMSSVILKNAKESLVLKFREVMV